MTDTEIYNRAVNRVMDYIDQHYMDPIKLEDLTRVSGFSSFHFNRLFKVLVNETPYKYIQRIRLERAALAVGQGRAPLTRIGLDHGFYDGPSFSRAFKKYFKLSPSAYRKNSKNIQVVPPPSVYTIDEDACRLVAISIVCRQAQEVVYIRKTGRYQGDYKFFMKPYGQVKAWLGHQSFAKAFASDDIVIYHDSPTISQEETLRVSIGVTVPRGFSDPSMNRLTLEGGKYLIASVEVTDRGYGQAWLLAYKAVLDHGCYKLRHAYAYEAYGKAAYDGLKKTCSVDICLPIE